MKYIQRYVTVISAKTEIGDKIKYCRLPNDTETQQENTKQSVS